MHRYHIIIEYVGTNFNGFQIQRKGKTVQKFIQSIISKILKEKVTIVASGRTDSGVHATGQSAHFDITKRIKNIKKLIQSLIFFIYLTFIIYLKHTENIKRLLNKTESKIKLSK